MASHIHAATINELACAYCLNGRQWFGTGEKDFKHAVSKVDPVTVRVQMARGATMANAIVQHLTSQPDMPKVQAVYWVARAGQLSRIVENATPNHPADIVVGLSNGSYWGISAKSSTSTQVPLRNPGLGVIEQFINVPIYPIVAKIIDKAVTELGCPVVADQRKTFLRANPTIQETTRKWGADVLRYVRDVVYQRMTKWSQDVHYTFMNKVLIQRDVYPQYVHVKGIGDSPDTYSAVIENPLAVSFENISAKASGNTVIDFYSHDARVVSLRAKFESEPLASTLKWSVE